jgi:hypothetical protein
MAQYKPNNIVYVSLNGINPSVKKAKIIYLHDDRYEREYSWPRDDYRYKIKVINGKEMSFIPEAWISDDPISTLKTP